MTTMETCDRCGPSVAATTTYVLASLNRLLFCGHHAAKMHEKLAPMSIQILDRTPAGWVEREKAGSK